MDGTCSMNAYYHVAYLLQDIKRQFLKIRNRGEDTIKISSKEEVKWIHLTQVATPLQEVVNAVIQFDNLGCHERSFPTT
jgi:hypothetical protein